MGQKGYRRISQAEVEAVWSRFYAGENLRQIGAAMARNVGTIQEIIAGRGGVRPPPRCRAVAQLTLEEREQISRGLAEGYGVRTLARALGRAASTVSREIARHGGATAYRAVAADACAYRNACRPKASKLATCPPLRRAVEQQLRRCWSPMQIASWLRQRAPDDPNMTVSHETICRTLYIQARGVFKTELTQY